MALKVESAISLSRLRCEPPDLKEERFSCCDPGFSWENTSVLSTAGRRDGVGVDPAAFAKGNFVWCNIWIVLCVSQLFQQIEGFCMVLWSLSLQHEP